MYHALLFELLLVDVDHNCTRTGFEVCACTVPLPHDHIGQKILFHELICLIQIFMKKFSWFSVIHEMFLTLNYFRAFVLTKILALQPVRLKNGN